MFFFFRFFVFYRESGWRRGQGQVWALLKVIRADKPEGKGNNQKGKNKVKQSVNATQDWRGLDIKRRYCRFRMHHRLNTVIVLNGKYTMWLLGCHYISALHIYPFLYRMAGTSWYKCILCYDKSHLRIKPLNKICTGTWQMLPFDGETCMWYNCSVTLWGTQQVKFSRKWMYAILKQPWTLIKWQCQALSFKIARISTADCGVTTFHYAVILTAVFQRKEKIQIEKHCWFSMYIFL